MTGAPAAVGRRPRKTAAQQRSALLVPLAAMGDDEEAEKMETTDSEGPRFVVKKVGCRLPLLLGHSSAVTHLYRAAMIIFFSAANNCHTCPLQPRDALSSDRLLLTVERRHLLVLGHLHWCALPPMCFLLLALARSSQPVS